MRHTADSVVFVPTDPLDVVERISSVTQEALVRLGVFLPRDRFRHHLEVHHVVARRCLMALGTIARRRRRVKKSCDSPSDRIMAPSAVASKQFSVRVTVAVTVRAGQPVLLGRLRHSNS